MTKSHQTAAWVIHAGPEQAEKQPAELVLEEVDLGELGDEEVLVRPIYGCWEGNMSHAIARRPVDVPRQRGEDRMVPGNAGVVQVIATGSKVTTAREGDHCIVFGNAISDRYGYPVKAYAYDAPNTVGILARTTRMPQGTVIPLPERSRFSLRQWAAFSLRYVTAWANWRVAHHCWRSQMTEEDMASPYVWAWGGGVALAELDLARRFGARSTMMATGAERLQLIESLGITAIDRSRFGDLQFDEQRYRRDADYKERYGRAERAFLDLVAELTGGEGVSIFVDNIGGPVYRATLKALGRQGVLATAGWKAGMMLGVVRAIECISRHIHVNTHYARYSEGLEAIAYAEESGWMAPEPPRVYAWDEIPILARDYAAGRVLEYFPVYQVNPE